MTDNNENKVLNVPHLRFPEFSGEWEIYPLTDFMSFKNGMNPDAKRFGRGTKFISVMDILNNQFICYDNIRASVEVVDGDIETYGVKITMPGNQLYTKLCNKYVANFTSLMRRENQQIQLMLILCYPVI